MLYERGSPRRLRGAPEEALAELHGAMVAAGGDPDLLFALAELSYLHGQGGKRPEYKLAAAVYAYAYLFPEGAGEGAGPLRPAPSGRGGPVQLVARGEASSRRTQGDSSQAAGAFPLPFGPIEVAFDPAALRAETASCTGSFRSRS